MHARYRNFSDFYPYYLREHRNRTCRRLHFAGTSLVILTVLFALLTRTPQALWLVIPLGYGFAWVGHFFFEKNRPATFTHPLYSLLGDFVMYRDILRGKIEL